jgi:hypothetical protein
LGDANSATVRFPLQSLRSAPVSTPPSLGAPLLSWGCNPSRSIIGSGVAAPIGLREPSSSFLFGPYQNWTSRFSRRFPPHGLIRGAHPPSGFRSPTEFHRAYPPRSSVQDRGRSHEVLSPTTLSVAWSPLTPGFPHPVRCAFRLSQPLDALLLQTPSGPISYRLRPWGSPLQSFFPTPSQDTLSSSSALLPLHPRVARLQGLLPGRGFAPRTPIFQGWPGAVALLGFQPLQGFLFFRDRTPNGFFLSWACPHMALKVQYCGRPSEFPSTEKLACLSRDCLPS